MLTDRETSVAGVCVVGTVLALIWGITQFLEDVVEAIANFSQQVLNWCINNIVWFVSISLILGVILWIVYYILTRKITFSMVSILSSTQLAFYFYCGMVLISKLNTAQSIVSGNVLLFFMFLVYILLAIINVVIYFIINIGTIIDFMEGDVESSTLLFYGIIGWILNVAIIVLNIVL